MTATNRQVVLSSRPAGIAQDETFDIVDTPVPEPADGENLGKRLIRLADTGD